MKRIPGRTLRALNVTMVWNDSSDGDREHWWFSACSLSGSMSERVFIKVSVSSEPGRVVVDVYSDHPSLPSKLSVVLKRALEGRAR